MTQPLLSDLRIVSAGPTHYLQHLTLDGPWRTLRPIRLGALSEDPALTADQPHIVVVGTPKSYELYDMHVLLDAVISPASAFDIDEAMPESIPMPEVMQYLSPTTMTVLIRGALGQPTEEIEAYLKSTDPELELYELRNDWESSDIHLLKSAAMHNAIEALKIRELAKMEAVMRAASASTAGTTNTEGKENEDEGEDAGSDDEDGASVRVGGVADDLKYGQTRRLTPEQLAAFERRLRTNYNARRMKWPFAKMEIGDVVRIEATLAVKGQRATHSYSSASGKLFATSRLRNGDLEVVRISGFRIPSTSKRT